MSIKENVKAFSSRVESIFQGPHERIGIHSSEPAVVSMNDCKGNQVDDCNEKTPE